MLRKRFVRRRRPLKKTREDKKQDRRISKIERSIRAELRYIHTDQDFTLLGSGGTFYLQNQMAQGDNDGDRSSNQINIRDISFRGFAYPEDSPGINDAQMVRIIIFVDNQQNGNLTTFLDVLQDNTNANLAVMSGYQIDTVLRSKRIKILYDRTKRVQFDSTFTSGGNTGSQLPITMWTFKKKFKKGILSSYSGTGGTIANIEKGGLWVLVVTNQNNSTNFGYSFAYSYTP